MSKLRQIDDLYAWADGVDEEIRRLQVRNSNAAGGSGGGASVQDDVLQPGVILPAHLALTVGSTSSVTIAAGSAWVSNISGLLVRATAASTVLGSIPAASASNFRLDQIVIASDGTVSRLAGTQSTTVTLANRTGAATIPAGSQLLHDVLVTSAGVLLANCRDRRPWARGAFWRGIRSTSTTTTSAALVQLAPTEFTQRVECSGAPLRFAFQGLFAHTVSNSLIYVVPYMDGQDIGGGTALSQGSTSNPATNAAGVSNSFQFVFLPTAGSHLFTIMWALALNAGTATLGVSASSPGIMTIEEILRPNAGNGAA